MIFLYVEKNKIPVKVIEYIKKNKLAVGKDEIIYYLTYSKDSRL